MKTEQNSHAAKVNDYYNKSSYGYKYILWGYQHFGYHPLGKKVSEKEAVVLAQDKIGQKLKLRDGMIVLDAGCARGLTASYFAKKYGCNTHGVDLNPILIQEAKINAENNGLKDKAIFHVMDYSKLDFGHETFDVIYTIETLCHSLDARKTLEEFRRVLKKNGKIALLEYTFEQDDKFSEDEFNILNKLMTATATHGMKNFRHNHFERILRSAGFKNIQRENISQNVLPSLYRFRRMALIPYNIIKHFRLQEKFPNLTIAIEWTKMVEKGFIRHNIFTAER